MDKAQQAAIYRQMAHVMGLRKNAEKQIHKNPTFGDLWQNRVVSYQGEQDGINRVLTVLGLPTVGTREEAISFAKALES